MLNGAEVLPIVESLYDIKEVGFYRCKNEIIKQCSAVVAGEEMKEIYSSEGILLGQTWSDKNNLMFRRNRLTPDLSGRPSNIWGQWFIVPTLEEENIS